MNILDLRRKALGWVLRADDGNGFGVGTMSFSANNTGDTNPFSGMNPANVGGEATSILSAFGPTGSNNSDGTPFNAYADLSSYAQSYGGWSAQSTPFEQSQPTAQVEAPKTAEAARLQSDPPAEKSLSERLSSWMSKFGIEPGVKSDDFLNNESSSHKNARMQGVGNAVANTVRSAMPGAGLMGAMSVGINAASDLAGGATLGDTASKVAARMGPGLINSQINKATGGLYGMANLASGAANELGANAPSLNFGKAAMAGFGGKPSPSSAPSTGGESSFASLSSSYGGWSTSGPNVEFLAQAEPTPESAPTFDLRLFKKTGRA